MSGAAEDESAEDEVVEQQLPGRPDDLPPIDFSTFIVSLRASALMHMERSGDAQGASYSLRWWTWLLSGSILLTCAMW